MMEGSYTLYSKACEVVYKASYLSFRDCETYTLRISCLISRGANGAMPQQEFSENSFFFMKQFENTTKYSSILHQTIECLAKNFCLHNVSNLRLLWNFRAKEFFNLLYLPGCPTKFNSTLKID